MADHHSEYLARAVAALTPEGRERAGELCDQLIASGGNHQWVVRFAQARQAEADLNRTDVVGDDEPGDKLSRDELDILLAGFMTIRDEERLDDVNDWANAVIGLLEDERGFA